MRGRRILGIDPGSRITGYGILDVRGSLVSPVAWGVIRTDGAGSFPDRLHEIQGKLSDVIRAHRPAEAAVEKVFLAKNASSALKLGQARGAALVTCRALGLAVHEYSAKEIKLAATGNGAAPKEQVAAMVGRLLGLREEVPPDAADALAAAFCRAVTRTFAP
ncbi:MAG: crossover junction endodeoxyribonuclease RuvC [Gemmatimonadota bacterium]